MIVWVRFEWYFSDCAGVQPTNRQLPDSLFLRCCFAHPSLCLAPTVLLRGIGITVESLLGCTKRSRREKERELESCEFLQALYHSSNRSSTRLWLVYLVGYIVDPLGNRELEVYCCSSRTPSLHLSQSCERTREIDRLILICR